MYFLKDSKTFKECTPSSFRSMDLHGVANHPGWDLARILLKPPKKAMKTGGHSMFFRRSATCTV